MRVSPESHISNFTTTQAPPEDTSATWLHARTAMTDPTKNAACQSSVAVQPCDQAAAITSSTSPTLPLRRASNQTFLRLARRTTAGPNTWQGLHQHRAMTITMNDAFCILQNIKCKLSGVNSYWGFFIRNLILPADAALVRKQTPNGPRCEKAL